MAEVPSGLQSSAPSKNRWERYWAWMSLPLGWRCALAVILVGVATGLRIALIPWLGIVAPYHVALVAVVAAAILLGTVPGFLTMVLGYLAVETFVLGSSPTLFAGGTLSRFAVNMIIGSFVVLILHTVRAATLSAQRNAARLNSFAAATFEGIVETEGGRILDCNEQFARMFGGSVAQMRGMAVRDLIVPGDRERVQANIQANRESMIEHGFMRKDGTRMIVEAHGRAVVSGSARRLTAVRDITARKQADEKLKEANEQLEQRVAQRTAELVKAGEQVRAERERFLEMLDTLPVIIDIIRADHRIEWANRAFREALGDNTGKLCYASQFNREEPCVECEAFTPLKTGEPHHWEWALPNGRTFDIYNFPFTASDGSPAVLEMDIDITEIRKAQAELREANTTLEQKVAERTAELRETHRQLQSVIDNSTTVVYALDLDERFIMANAPLAELLQTTPERMIGKRRHEFMPKEDADWHEANDRKVIEAGQAIEFEETSQLNGRSITWLTTKFPLRDEEGKIYAVAGVSADFTERKLMEEKLRASEELLRAVTENTADAIYVKDRQSRWLLANPALLKIAGKRLEEVLGKTDLDIYGDPEIGAEILANDARIMEKDLPEEFEERALTTEGVRVFLSTKAPRRDAQGNVIGLIGISRDITERKRAQEALRKSEERYRVVAETMLQGIVHQNAEGIITAMNSAAESILGKTKEDFLGSSSMKEEPFTVREDGSRFPGNEHPAMVALRTGQPSRGTVMGVYNPRMKERRWISIDAIPLSRPGETHPSEVYTMFADITERKEMLEALTQAKEQLRRYSENLEKIVEERTTKLRELVGELEHFSYTITHDMRAPLRAMQGFSQLMLENGCEGCSNEISVGMLKRIMTGANRMDQLITDALNYARIVRMELPMAKVELGPLVQGILDTYPNLQPPQVEIRVDGDLPAVIGNEAALTQCFSNLLGNAVKFVEAGKTPKVRIWAEALAKEASMVRIWVEDNGIGIPKDYFKRIFEMFGRVDKKYEGTGIGLALVRKNVERMGGKLGVESELGKGSRFWMELQVS